MSMFSHPAPASTGTLLLFAFVVTCSAVSSGGGACSSSLDCFLNGDCLNQSCVCDAAWDGDNCNILAELESIQLWPSPTVAPPANLSELASSWGASIAVDSEGVYHAYFDVVCANYTWMHIAGAVIVHATSTALEGPYAYFDIALPQQSMTPHIVYDNTSSQWLLLHQRQPNVSGIPLCTGDYGTAHAVVHSRADTGMQSSPTGYANGPPSVASSPSLYGPWTPHDFNVSVEAGDILPNPNPSVLPPAAAGQPYMLAFTSMPANFTTWGTERVGVAVAPTWNSPDFTPVAGDVLSSTSPGEDPHLWRSSRGWHIVYHAMDVNANLNFTGVGGYAASMDGVHWRFSPTPIYTTSMNMVGQGPVTFARRERPEMVLDPVTGVITHVLNGVERIVRETGHSSLSVITRVRTAAEQ